MLVLLAAITILTLTVAVRSVFAVSMGHVAAGTASHLAHDLSFVNVSLEPPTMDSNLTSDSAIKQARGFLPPSISDPIKSLAGVTYGIVRDQHEFAGGKHAWVVSFNVNIPKAAVTPGDENNATRARSGHIDTIDIIVDDQTGTPLRSYVHGVWD